MRRPHCKPFSKAALARGARAEHREHPEFSLADARRIARDHLCKNPRAYDQKRGKRFGDYFHTRAAQVLGWPVKETESVSLSSLRELVRQLDPTLAAEMSRAIQSGAHIRGKTLITANMDWLGPPPSKKEAADYEIRRSKILKGFGAVSPLTRMKGLGPKANTFVASSAQGRYRVYKTWDGKWAVNFKSLVSGSEGNIRDDQQRREWPSKARAVQAMRDHDAWLTKYF